MLTGRYTCSAILSVFQVQGLLITVLLFPFTVTNVPSLNSGDIDTVGFFINGHFIRAGADHRTAGWQLVAIVGCVGYADVDSRENLVGIAVDHGQRAIENSW